MPSLVASDTILRVPPGQAPDYNSGNPLVKVLAMGERQRLAAERHFYLTDDLQALLPFSHLDFAGPQGQDADLLYTLRQDTTTDFQDASVPDSLGIETYLLRARVTPRR